MWGGGQGAGERENEGQRERERERERESYDTLHTAVHSVIPEEQRGYRGTFRCIRDL